MSASLLTVDGVTLQYRTPRHLVTATYRVSFSVGRSDRFVILGPSGCGKSTMLKAVGGYVRPVEGRIILNDAPIRAPGPDRVFVFQEFDQLLPWKTVKNNITFALTASGTCSRRDAEDRARQLIDKVKLTRFADSYPHTLSGGMKQRVALARAMAMEPQILLMDEPASALDPIATQRIEELIYQLKSEYTIVIVTHNMQQAARVSDYTAFFWLGKLVEFGATDRMFTNPSEKLTEDYVTGRFG